MGTFDIDRAYRMIAVASLVAWLAFAIGIVIDVASVDSGGAGEGVWRFRLTSLANVANPGIILWLAVAMVLSAAHASRRLMLAFAGVAAAGTLLGLAEIWNLATAGDSFSVGNEATRIALQTGGVALTVTMLAVVRDRLAAFAEDEFVAAAADEPPVVVEMDYPLSSPDENR